MVRVTDDGIPPLSDTKSFTVTVSAVSGGPVLSLTPNQSVSEQTLLSLQLNATIRRPFQQPKL